MAKLTFLTAKTLETNAIKIKQTKCIGFIALYQNRLKGEIQIVSFIQAPGLQSNVCLRHSK